MVVLCGASTGILDARLGSTCEVLRHRRRACHGSQPERCRCGETGKRGNLTRFWVQALVGSNPTTGTGRTTLAKREPKTQIAITCEVSAASSAAQDEPDGDKPFGSFVCQRLSADGQPRPAGVRTSAASFTHPSSIRRRNSASSSMDWRASGTKRAVVWNTCHIPGQTLKLTSTPASAARSASRWASLKRTSWSPTWIHSGGSPFRSISAGRRSGLSAASLPAQMDAVERHCAGLTIGSTAARVVDDSPHSRDQQRLRIAERDRASTAIGQQGDATATAPERRRVVSPRQRTPAVHLATAQTDRDQYRKARATTP
jgi:hypothetical protein